MSYIGEELCICTKGHLSSVNCYPGINIDTFECPLCKSGAAWWGSVDLTNDEGVWPVFEILQERTTRTCEHCNHTEIVEQETYYIPFNFGRIYQKGHNTKDVKFCIGNSDYKVFDTQEEAYDFLHEKNNKIDEINKKQWDEETEKEYEEWFIKYIGPREKENDSQ